MHWKNLIGKRNMDHKKLHKQHAEHFEEHNKGMHNYGYHMDQNPEKANLKEAVESHKGTLSTPGMEEGSIHDPGK